jgi:ribosomal protein S18 acetylase RimI-like enzyme
MKPTAPTIVPMKRSHIKACDGIVAASEPWKTLNEGIDFASAFSRNGRMSKAYVCMLGGEPAGFILFTPEPVFARGGYLRAIGVSPKFRRQGIGKKLLEFAENMTARHSLYFYLCVSSFNRKAQAFYRDRGYTRVGKLPGLIMPGASEYIYWRKLRPR